MPHLYVSISAHGFGHGAITTPVLQALAERVPGLRLTIATGIPRTWLAGRLDCAFDHLPTQGDIGLIMNGPTDVDLGRSRAAYIAYHGAWEKTLAAEVDVLRRLKPDLVLSNIGYLSLAAARRIGIPAVALAPFGWSDILASYFKGDDQLNDIVGDIGGIYGAAALFLKPDPCLPPSAPNQRRIGAIARSGMRREGELRVALGLSAETKLGLVTFGGIAGGEDILSRWVSLPDWRWIVGENFPAGRADMIPFAQTGMPFVDLIASADVVVAKPGYGTYTEAACGGARLLTMERPDWPEWPHLAAYIARNCASIVLTAEQFLLQNYEQELRELSAMDRRQAAPADGVEDAARAIIPLLGSSTRRVRRR